MTTTMSSQPVETDFGATVLAGIEHAVGADYAVEHHAAGDSCAYAIIRRLDSMCIWVHRSRHNVAGVELLGISGGGSTIFRWRAASYPGRPTMTGNDYYAGTRPVCWNEARDGWSDSDTMIDGALTSLGDVLFLAGSPRPYIAPAVIYLASRPHPDHPHIAQFFSARGWIGCESLAEQYESYEDAAVHGHPRAVCLSLR